MSSTLRSLLIKVGVDLSQYTTAINDLKKKQTEIEAKFRTSANAMDNWKGTSEGLALRVSSLTQKIDAQKQILNQLEAEYNAVKGATGEDSEATKKLETQYVNASKQLDKMNTELVGCKDELYKTATAEGKTGAEAKQMGGEMKTAGTKAKGFKDNISEFANSSVGQFATLAAAVAFAKQAFSALWDTITEAADYADEMLTLSNKTGVAVDTLQKFQYAAKFIDTELETFTGSLKKLNVAMYDASRGMKEQQDIFADLGVEYKNADGTLRNNEETFYDLIDALGGMSDETTRDAYAMKLMGKSAQDLNPLIKAGKEQLKKYGDEAEKTGSILKTSQIAVLAKLDDQLEKTSAAFEANMKKNAASLAPLTTEIAKWYEKLVTTSELEEQAIGSVMYTYKLSREQAILYLETYRKYTEVMNEAGKSNDDFRLKLSELQTELLSRGVPQTELMTTALNKMNATYITSAEKAELLKQKQAELNTAVDLSLTDYLAKQEEYLAQLDTTTKKYLDQMGGLFGEFPAKLKQSKSALRKEKDDILGDLKSQVEGFKSWSGELSKLSKRGVDEGVINELKQLGPKALPQVQALNSMSDTELNKFIALSTEKTALAREAAVKELEPLAQEVSEKYDALATAIKNKEDALEEAGKGVGGAIGDGVAKGITSKLPSIVKASNKITDAALAAMRSRLDSHSPSKEAMKIGSTIPQGMAGGIKKDTGLVLREARTMASDTLNAFSGIDGRAGYSLPDSAVSQGAAGSQLNRSGVVETTINIDGKAFARVATPYVDKELQSISTSKSRAGGY